MIKTETSDTVTLCLKQPILKKIKYLPGQYLTLVFRINGRKYIRPYSFSSAPGVDQYLEVTVKRVTDGVVSNHINDFVKEGDTVEVIPPMGEFIFDKAVIGNEKHVVLWGAGSGITPLISIAKYILYTGKSNKVKLIYGNRNKELVIFAEQIARMENDYKDQLRTWHFHTQLSITEDNEHIIEGRINPQLVLDVIKDEIDLNNTIHYICGPAGLKESVKSTLISLGVSNDQIFSEDFEIERNEADFEGITTQFVEIKQGGVLNKIEVTKGKSILNAGLDAMLDLDYSCQTGSCLLCRGKILRGQIKMIGLKSVPDKLNYDECLMCCGYPLSDDVQIGVL